MRAPHVPAVAILAVAAAALVTVYLKSASFSTVPESARTFQGRTLRLGVQQAEEQIRVTWDARQFESGRTGTLSLGEPNFTSSVYLNPRQFQAGEYSYTPRGKRVSVRLDVDGGSGSLRESVSFEHVDVHVNVATQVEVEPLLLDSRARKDMEPEQTDVQSGTVQAGAAGKVEAKPFSIAALLQPKNSPLPKETVLEPLKALALAGGSTGPNLPFVPRAASPPPILAAGVRYLPPTLLKDAPIVVPPNVSRMLEGDYTLSVRVDVDENGKVSRAIPGEHVDKRQQFAANLCVSAARLYRFRAAQRDGQSVSSEAILTFRIGRGGVRALPGLQLAAND